MKLLDDHEVVKHKTIRRIGKFYENKMLMPRWQPQLQSG